jgi:putative DNA primase/helicase
VTLAERYTFGDGEHVALRLMPCITRRDAVAEPEPPTPLPAWLANYARRGFALVFWTRGSNPNDWKGPTDHGWNMRVYAPDDWRDGMQVGVKTGTTLGSGRFLLGVDFDWPPSVQLARRFLPATSFGFGRASKSVSHVFFSTSLSEAGHAYEDPSDGQMLVELRGAGQQTLAPPSLHPSGESVLLQPNGDLTPDDTVPRRVLLLAIACLVVKHLPARSFSHDARNALAGFLLQRGLRDSEVIAIAEAIAEATGNDVRDAAHSVHSTAERVRKGEAVTGRTHLAEALGAYGPQVCARIAKWCDGDVLVLNPNDPLPSAREYVTRQHTVADVLTLRHQHSVFYAYDASVGAYHEHDDATVRARLYRFLELAYRPSDPEADARVRFQPTRSKVENVLDALRAVCNLPSAQRPPCWLVTPRLPLAPFDILACPNGLLHIPTRTLHPATPQFFTLNGIDFPFDAAAPSPTQWLAFLTSLWPDDPELPATLQEIFGYVLTPDTRQQKIFMLVGPPRSGKGVTGRVLRCLVGDRNVCSPTLAAFGRDFGKQVLVGKTLALISDARIGGRTDTAVVAETLLSISGEDAQTVERKFLPDWNGKLAVRFVLLTNELPRLGEVSGALAKRFIVLPLTESFYGREDLGLFDRFVPELPGILNWALAGRDRLVARGYFVQPTAATDLIQDLADLASPEATFLREWTRREPGATVSQKELFAAWQTWATENGRDHAGTVQTFGRNVRAVLPWVTTRQLGPRGEQERYWEGLRLVMPGRPGFIGGL